MERTSVVAELRSYDSPHSLLYDEVLSAAFQVHPYRNNTIGFLTDVESVSRDVAYRFYERFYNPRNAVLVRGRRLLAGGGACGRERAVRVAAPGRGGRLRRDPRAAAGRRAPDDRAQAGAPRRGARRLPGPGALGPRLPGHGALRRPPRGGQGPAVPHRLRSAEGRPPREGPGRLRRGAERSVRVPGVAPPLRVHLAREHGSGRCPGRGRGGTVRGPRGRGDPRVDRGRSRAGAEAGAGRPRPRPRHPRRSRPSARLLRGLGGLRAPRGAAEPPPVDGPGGGAPLREGEADARPGHGRVVRAHARGPRLHLRSGEAARSRGRVSRARPAHARRRPPPAIPPPPAGPPLAPTATRLTNGLTLRVSRSTSTGLVALHGRIDAGPVHEGSPGVAAVAARLFGLGAQETGGPPLVLALDEDPARSSNARFIEFQATGLPEDLPVLARAVAAAFRADPSRLEDARRAALEGAEAAESDTDTVLVARARAALFATTSPLARPPWGTAESLARVSGGDVEGIPATVRRAFPRRAERGGAGGAR